MSIGRQVGQTLADEELVKLFQTTGNSEYFAELFTRHRGLVYCACRRFFGSNGLAEDATQETFLRAFQAMAGYREGNVSGWFMRIARNVCIDLWRKQKPESQSEDVTSIDRAEGIGFEHRMQVNRAMENLREEMKLLHEEQRICVEMKMEGYSYEETAARTQMPVGAVKSHLQNGRRMLWARMREVLLELP